MVSYSRTLTLSSCHFRTGRLKSPWSRRKRKLPLSPQQWRSLFTSDGKFRDGGVKFLKKVRSRVSRHFRQPIVLISQVLGLLPLGYLNKPSIYIVMQGVDPSIRVEVWPFLLGV